MTAPAASDETERLVDSRRGWLVVLGTFLASFVNLGIAYSFGAFFADMAAEFDTTRGQTAVVFGITTFAFFWLTLEAQAAADDALTTLFLGLGAVALLVGGIGIANVMVIAVIERRGEIGLRRSLGATRAHIRQQFLTEAVFLSILGGMAGVAIGSVATVVYATSQGWRVILSVEAVLGGFVAAVAIGAVAGLYPAMRAAKLAPTEALRS